MVKLDANSTLKRLRNRYRVVVMNEDTYEEVIKFRLSRLSVYIFLSSAFVFITILMAALIVFTPVKYYIPGVGYGDARQQKAYRQLKIRTDSIEQALKYNQQYIDDVAKVLEGKIVKRDKSKLNLPKIDKSEE
ncbi:MAG: hypothetical protein HY305_05940 [Sphingobacteriales bacterium]|nr:hypothetical protein [Sphingobacteriales bacterium]